MSGALLEGGGGWALELRLNFRSAQRFKSHILSGDQNWLDGWKSPSPVHKKVGQRSPPFTVLSLLAESDTCHIWASAGAEEQGAGWSVTSRRQRTRHPLTAKSLDKSKRGDRAQLVTRRDNRQKLWESQRYHSLCYRHDDAELQSWWLLYWKLWMVKSVWTNCKEKHFLTFIQQECFWPSRQWRYLCAQIWETSFKLPLLHPETQTGGSLSISSVPLILGVCDFAN